MLQHFKIDDQSMFIKVKGSSMLPIIRSGDVLVVRKYSLLNIGDIISFYQGESIITHRILNITNIITTKGDNVGKGDRPITPNQVIGVAKMIIRRKNGKMRITPLPMSNKLAIVSSFQILLLNLLPALRFGVSYPIVKGVFFILNHLILFNEYVHTNCKKLQIIITRKSAP